MRFVFIILFASLLNPISLHANEQDLMASALKLQKTITPDLSTKDNKESIKISDNDSVIKSDIDTVIRKNSADLSIIKKIEELNRLKEDKILTEEEFSKLKNKLIDG